jgi:hypothetical protein
LRTADKIAEKPEYAAQHEPQRRHRHIGADEAFEPQKIVTGRGLPIQTAQIDAPMREIC